MRRIAPFIAALSLTLALAGSASAGGLSLGRLQDAGWTCFDVDGPLGVHCMSRGDAWGQPQVQLLYFDTQSVSDRGASFLGTESLIRADLYAGQPCPTQSLPDYFFIPPLGYYACHRN